jgi:antitoxin component of RelBE/YafQ-DinJ toxin-antitoxin module
MSTHTILSIKTDKKLKAELGVPLSTVINAFLKQFVQEKELTLTANPLRPTPYLEQILVGAQAEYEAGKARTFKTGDDMLKHLERERFCQTPETSKEESALGATKIY